MNKQNLILEIGNIIADIEDTIRPDITALGDSEHISTTTISQFTGRLDSVIAGLEEIADDIELNAAMDE